MKILRITDFSVGITLLNQRIISKDYIELATEFPCLLGHPVRAHNSLRSTRRSPSGLWRGTTVGRRAADFK